MKTQNEQLQNQFKEQMNIMNLDVHSKVMFQIFELLTNPSMKHHKQVISQSYWDFKDNNKKAIFSKSYAENNASNIKQVFDKACVIYELGLVNKKDFRSVYGGTVVRFWKILQEDIEHEQKNNPKICQYFKKVANDLITEYKINDEPYRVKP